MSELAKAYVPADAEAEVTARWEASDAFHAVPAAPDAQTYSIVIPPPNVTAALHLGHALNNTLQDVLIRYHRMRGIPTLWMPGTDHAGIATQTVVEKRLLNAGIKRLEMGREEFVFQTQKWKDEYEATIIVQLKAMGASCDWDRNRFTMDDMCATAVRHAFCELFADGLIYRGKRLVNWDPVTRTALADDEVEMEDVAGHMWYLRYPLEDGSGHVTVATTRPETMLGDTAVAVNPDDPAADSVVGKYVDSSDRRPSHPDRRRRLRRHGRPRVERGQGAVRQWLPQGHAGPRPERLGHRSAPRAGGHQRDGTRRFDQ